MKKTSLKPSLRYKLFFLLFLFFNQANAQNIKRNIHLQFLEKDSVVFSFSPEYQLIEDSCAQIIRHAHYNRQTKKFSGRFQDIKKADPTVVLAEGSYSQEGFKNGSFISHYLNGNLQSKGTFENNKLVGRWELFYENGKPKTVFQVDGNQLKLTDAWNGDGVKIVNQGNGKYKFGIGYFYYEGIIRDGLRDGTWNAYKANNPSVEIVTEQFSNGTFEAGKGPMGPYSDKSNFSLLQMEMLPYVKAEQMRLGTPCSIDHKNATNAKFENGTGLPEHVKDAIALFLGKFDLKSYDNELLLNGEIDKNGNIARLTSSTIFNEEIVRGLIHQIKTLTKLTPATFGGKSTTQEFKILFNFNQGYYTYKWQFLGIKTL